jgi:thioester reductase-like protein
VRRDERDVAAALRAHAKTVGLAAYEVPAEIVVEREPFSVANGLLTASGKLARPALVEKYGALLSTQTRPTRIDPDGDLAARIARIASGIARRTITVDEPLGAGIGVDSLAAAEILAAISDALDREIPLAWWFQSRTLAELAERLSLSNTPHDAANLSRARADLALPAAPTVPVRRGKPRRVLLTGATGFLGAFLVEALHDRELEVTCLVRARDDAHAQQRLDEALARRHLTARARAIAGDLAALEVDADVDAVVHAGATVSWLASYEALRAPNVLGTHALFTWAAARGIAFHHVSTISTVPADGNEQSSLTFEQALASTPYGLSKWIAERHVRGGIYRPAMIAPDTRRGIGNADDYLNRYMAGVRELGVYIDRDDAIIDMTPVDFVAKAIAACVACDRLGETLHLANIEQSMSYGALGRALVAAGVAARPVPYDAFRAALHDAKTSRLHALAAFFRPVFSLGMGPWPCAHSLAVLAELGVERPRIDEALIARYVSAQRDEGG